jgi:hypothetical protein
MDRVVSDIAWWLAGHQISTVVSGEPCQVVFALFFRVFLHALHLLEVFIGELSFPLLFFLKFLEAGLLLLFKRSLLLLKIFLLSVIFYAG